MATAKDLLRGRKPGEVFSVHPEASVMQAARLLAEHNVGALLVMSSEGEIEGILSERDIVRKVDLRDCTAADMRVSDIMTPRVLYVESSQSLEACMALMNEKGVRHLPVLEKRKLLGMISVRDVLRTIIREQEIVISHLENYIRGG
jgi:CBS domain-containing protein